MFAERPLLVPRRACSACNTLRCASILLSINPVTGRHGVGMADLLEMALLFLEPFIPRDLLARLPFWAEVVLCIAILGGMGLWIWVMCG